MFALIIFTIISAIYGFIGGKLARKKEWKDLRGFLSIFGFGVFFFGTLYLAIGYGISNTDCSDYNQGPCYTTHPTPVSILLKTSSFEILLIGLFTGAILGFIYAVISKNHRKD